ncbi:MAG TPA: hypothetical protein VGM53_15580 [Streptosporangiaceae bacterium]
MTRHEARENAPVNTPTPAQPEGPSVSHADDGPGGRDPVTGTAPEDGSPPSGDPASGSGEDGPPAAAGDDDYVPL